MGYSFSFADNEIYGAEDINAAISRLTTAGVTICPTDGNLIAAMNGVTAAVAEAGVDFDQYSCKVTADDEKIRISPGTAFFDDGMCMVIDTDGAELELKKEAYVYLFEDIHKNRCYPCVSSELPEDKYVLLAYINQYGGVQDKRTYATSKLVQNSPVVPKKYTVTLRYGQVIPEDKPAGELEAGFSNFTNVVFKNAVFSGYVALNEGDFSEEQNLLDRYYIKFKKIGTKLEAYIRAGINSDTGVIYENAFDMYLF